MKNRRQDILYKCCIQNNLSIELRQVVFLHDQRIFRKLTMKGLSFDHNCLNFLIPKSLQPDGVNL